MSQQGKTRWSIVIAAVGIPCLLLAGLYLVSQPGGQDAVAPQSTVDHSPEMQQRREAFIAKLQSAGVFTRVENRGGGLVRVWTGTAFDGLDFQDKQTFLSLVYAYYFDGNGFADTVYIYDGRSGKEIGRVKSSAWK